MPTSTTITMILGACRFSMLNSRFIIQDYLWSCKACHCTVAYWEGNKLQSSQFPSSQLAWLVCLGLAGFGSLYFDNNFLLCFGLCRLDKRILVLYHASQQLCHFCIAFTKAHCQQGSQTASPAVAADLPWVPMLLAVLDWTPAMRLPKQALMPAFGITAGAAPPGAIPLYLSLQVLRN